MARKLGIYAVPILVVLALAPASAAIAAPAAGARTCTTWVQMTSRNPSTGDNLLTGVTAVSPGNVWAVGQYFVGVNTNTLIEHWNGTTWKVVKSPSPGEVNSLNGVYAASGSDIWAVGSDASGSSSPQTLIEHWNGTSWKVVRSANGDTESNQLTAVRPLSATDAWSAGWYTKGSVNRSLIEHWSKGRWHVVYSPNGSNSTNELQGVLATSAASAWAAGWDYDPSAHADRTLLLHWNGHHWRKSVSPDVGTSSNDLNAIGATSATNVYAVGGAGQKALILHWNGRRWGVEPGRNPGSDANELEAVYALSPASVYAVGITDSGGRFRTLIEHCR